MYSTVYWEISGVCNGNCPYCVTGKNCVIGRNMEDIKARKFISIDDFRETIKHLIETQTIVPGQTTLSLFNWGEPFLHPELESILSIICEHNLRYIISTNCSILKILPPHLLRNCERVIFSMSGFSQDSYNRIHGFDFEAVKRNLVSMVIIWRKSGYTGTFNISFHVYQFNITEIPYIKLFAKELNIECSPIFATLNGFKLMEAFRNKTMSYDQMEKTRSELITYFYKDLSSTPDRIEHCSQFDILTINEYCELLPCCGVERGLAVYSFGDIRKMSLQEIIQTKKNADFCKLCIKSGLLKYGESILTRPVQYYP
ncbi:MAG: radical SAM protein [Fibrobacteres bacterium]|nr:radical SAM protein [Fibrobacterota bacterium]